MKYIGPKDRLSRKVGIDLFGKGPKLTRLNVLPGVHGPKGGKKLSEYGRQLREKQKARYIYGMSEKQFSRYVGMAQKAKGNTGEALVQLLERRLDNIVYRLAFAPTRSAARQLVSHKHVLVDNKVVNISSYLVSEGQVITLDSKGQNIPEVKKTFETREFNETWLERKALVGKLKNYPKREDITEPISEQDIVEYYSR